MSPARAQLPRFPAARANTSPGPSRSNTPPGPSHAAQLDAADNLMSAHIDPALTTALNDHILQEVQRRLRELTAFPTPAVDRKPLYNIDIPRHLSNWPADALLSGVDTFRIWDCTLQDRVGATLYTYITTGQLPDCADEIDYKNAEVFAIRQVSEGVAGNVRKSLLTVEAIHHRAQAYYEHLNREYNPTSSQSTLRLLHAFFNIPRAPIDEKGFVEWMAEFLNQSACLESAQLTIMDVITARALTLIPDELDAFRQYMELHSAEDLPTAAHLMALAHKQVKNHHDTRNSGPNVAAFAAAPSSSSRPPPTSAAKYPCPACNNGTHRVRNCPDADARTRYIERRYGQQRNTTASPIAPPEDPPIVATISRFQELPDLSTSGGQNW